MIPTNNQFERAKWLCTCLRGAGYSVSFKTMGTFDIQHAAICIEHAGKVYRLSDPDWDVINKQLGQLVNACAMS